MERVVKPFGLWTSALTAKSMAAGKRLSDVAWDQDGETVVWLESRSDRAVLVATHGKDAPRDITVEQSVRAKVGYGGGDFTVARGYVYFADAESGRLFRQSLAGGSAHPVTPAFGSAASPQVSPDGKWLLYVHHDEERVDRLAIVDVEGREWPQMVASGRDFYTQPRWSADGTQIAFVAWDHPQMPWDGTSLYLTKLDVLKAGLPRATSTTAIAGGTDTAIFQPEFSADGKTLYYISDESGFGQMYAHDLALGANRQVTKTSGAEYALPNWGQESRTYALTSDSAFAYACVNKRGFTTVHKIDLSSGEATIVVPLAAYSDASQIRIAPKSGRVALLGSSAKIPARVLAFDPAQGSVQILARTSAEALPAAELSSPEAISWQTANNEESHGLFYPPVSTHFQCSGKPPLIVIVHGGPTSQARAGWSAQAQFFTTRGYAVLFVNHRGSTGYGRDYMKKLRGRWGQLDVEDSVSGVRALAERHLIDEKRTVIMGGSAGGYTVLQTMVDEPEAFTAGICLYGIANQFTLVQDTHKFEERYSDSLLGPLPEAAALYRERSPLFKAENIKRPLAVFQGEQDKVVPQSQSDQIVQALKRNGTPHVYHIYAGEGHGWRKAETIEHFYNAVDAFLKEHLIYQ